MRKYKKLGTVFAGTILTLSILLALAPETFADTETVGTYSPLTEEDIRQIKDTLMGITNKHGTFLPVDQLDLSSYDESEILYEHFPSKKKPNAQTKVIVLDDKIFLKQ